MFKQRAKTVVYKKANDIPQDQVSHETLNKPKIAWSEDSPSQGRSPRLFSHCKTQSESTSSIDQLKISAYSSGDSEAMARLGYHFLYHSIPTNKICAKSWFITAITPESNSPTTCWVQGLMYLEGLSRADSGDGKREAFNLFQKGAQSGHVGALYNLGMCYKNGIGVACDYEKLLNYWHRLLNNNGQTPNMKWECFIICV